MKLKKAVSVLLCIIMLLSAAPGALAEAYLPDPSFTVTASGNTFTVTRSDNRKAQTVRYRTVSLSALDGVHFVKASGTLTFAAGGADSQTVTVTEKTPSQISDADALFRYQNQDRVYRFEVIDDGGFVLADCTRSIERDSSYGISSSVYCEKTFSVLTNEVTVTDSGFAQAYHAVPIADFYGTDKVKDYLASSRASTYMSVSLEAKEISDGYQYIQIVPNNTANCDTGAGDGDPGAYSGGSFSVYKAGFSHDGGTKNADYKKYSFPVPSAGNNSEASLPWNDAAHGNNGVGNLVMQRYNPFMSACASDGRLVIPNSLSTLGIRFNASGSLNDDWTVKDVTAKISAAPGAPQADNILLAQGRNAKHNRATVTVVFNQIVNVTGTPTLTTSWGTLTYAAGSGTNALAFTGDITADAGTQFRATGLSGTVKGITGISHVWPGAQTISSAVVGSTSAPQSAGGTLQIKSVSDFLYFADRIESYPATNAVMTADVDLSHLLSFTGMGGAAGYAGTFDGAGHTIRGLSKADAANGFGGLFRSISASGAVKNLRLEGVRIEYFSPLTCGLLCGQNNGTIENCTVSGTLRLTGSADASGQSVGTICGVNAGTVKNCAAYNSGSDYLMNIGFWNDLTVGGVAGSSTGLIEGCFFCGRYSIYSSHNITRGAIVGSNTGTVRNCAGLHDTSNYFDRCVGDDAGVVENVTFPESDTFTSGEACFTLNGGVTDGTQIWGQNVDGEGTADPLPVLGGPTVYSFSGGYSNSRYYNINVNVTGGGSARVCDSFSSDVLSDALPDSGLILVCEADSGYTLKSYTVFSAGQTTLSDRSVPDDSILDFSTCDLTMPADDLCVNVVFVPYYQFAFLDHDYSVIRSGNAHENTVISQADPSRTADAQYTWTFSGWNDGTTDYAPGEELPPLTADVTYVAQYSSEVNFYTVTFLNYDGSIFLTEYLPYGATPSGFSEDDEKPTRPQNGSVTYVFNGWNHAFTPVRGDQFYTATYYQNETGSFGGLLWSAVDGTLSISGSGAIPSEDSPSDYPWANYSKRITDLVILEGVTEIGEGAFGDFTALQNVSLPLSLTGIEDFAFADCPSIVSAEYAGSAAQWDLVGVGYYNEQLTSKLSFALYSIFPDRVGQGLIWIALGADGGETVTLTPAPGQGHSLSSLDVYYFGPDNERVDISTTQLAGDYTFTMPEADVYIRVVFRLDMSGSLYGANWTLVGDVLTFSGQGSIGEHGVYPYSNYASEISRIVIGSGISTILSGAFTDFLNLTTVSIAADSSLGFIGEGAFKNCVKLEAIELPDSVDSIETDAFYNCLSLTSVSIPASVTSLGNSPFEKCSGLTSVFFHAESALETIPDGAFSSCTSLQSVSLPASLGSIGADAFKDCDGLTEVYFPGSEEEWAHVDILSGNDVLSGVFMTFGQRSVFNNCPESVQTEEMPYGASAGDPVFFFAHPTAGWELESVVLSYTADGVPQTETLTSEGNLYSFTMPDCDVTVNFNVYRYTGGSWYDVEWLVDHSSLTITGTGEIRLSPSDVYPWTSYANEISSLYIDGRITLLSSNSFSGFAFLTDVFFPADSALTSIGERVFYQAGINSTDADGLVFHTGDETFALPGHLRTINKSAFYGSAVKRLSLPESLVYILSSAFANSSLSEIYINAGASSIYDYAFNSTSISDVYYGGSETEWASVSVNSKGNDPLLNASFHYSAHLIHTAAAHGSASSSRPFASEGETVALTLTPDAGRRVSHVSLNGAALEPVNGAYSFAMPASDAYVNVVFAPFYADANGDGQIDTLDLTRLRQYLASPDDASVAVGADVNADGVIDTLDLTRLRQYLADPTTVLGPQT